MKGNRTPTYQTCQAKHSQTKHRYPVQGCKVRTSACRKLRCSAQCIAKCPQRAVLDCGETTAQGSGVDIAARGRRRRRCPGGPEYARPLHQAVGTTTRRLPAQPCGTSFAAKRSLSMEINCERHGAGPPLLLVHGLGGSVRSWDSILPMLAREREVILVDLPGHGVSPALPGRQTIAAYADALEHFIDRNGLAGVDTAGSSVGARLGLELARRGIGGHTVAYDPGGFWRGWEMAWFRSTLAASVRLVRLLRRRIPALSHSRAARTVLLAQLSARPGALDPMLVQNELTAIAETNVFDAMLRELARGPLQEGTATPPSRVTIGWGRQDRLLLPRQAERAQAAFPTARLHWFERCGHFPQWDRPKEAAEVILKTIAR